LSYLKTFPEGRVIIDTSYPDHSMYPVEDHSNWIEFYPDASEEIPKDLRPEKGPRVMMTVYVDADHTHDLVTRRFITGILVMLNNTPIRWVSKHQKTVETSTYSSELVASRVATGLILEVTYMLRSLGVTLNGPALMLGDNMSVVLNTIRLSCDIDNLTFCDIEDFANVDLRPKLKHFHPFGCPGYALTVHDKRLSKWDTRVKVGIYIGTSPKHASTVHLVLNPCSGLVSLRFHVRFDDLFHTTNNIKISMERKITIQIDTYP
jgi:hypothetical protein